MAAPASVSRLMNASGAWRPSCLRAVSSWISRRRTFSSYVLSLSCMLETFPISLACGTLFRTQ